MVLRYTLSLLVDHTSVSYDHCVIFVISLLFFDIIHVERQNSKFLVLLANNTRLGSIKTQIQVRYIKYYPQNTNVDRGEAEIDIGF